jgi:hypothetical protein
LPIRTPWPVEADISTGLALSILFILSGEYETNLSHPCSGVLRFSSAKNIEHAWRKTVDFMGILTRQGGGIQSEV